MTNAGQSYQWWRWPLMPFAALIGGQVGAFVFNLFQWLSMKFYGGYSPDGWMYIYVLPLMSAAVFGYLFAYIACTMAPSAKWTAGVVMTAVLGTVLAVLLIFIWLSPAFGTGKSIFESVKATVTIVGAVAGLLQLKEELAGKI